MGVAVIKTAEFKPDFKRLDAVLKGKSCDVVPLFEYFADPEIIETVTGKKYSPEAIVEFYYSMGYDYVHVPLNLDYDIRKKTTSDTAVLSRGERSFVDISHGVIESREDFDSYDWPAVDIFVAKNVLDIVKFLPDNVKIMLDITPGGVYEILVWVMGYNALSEAMFEDEQLVLDVIKKASESIIKSMELCIQAADGRIGAIAYGDDLGFNTGTMLSPAFLRKHIFPEYKLHADLAHRFDLPFIFHSCGKIDAIMPDLIDYVGIDAKHSFQHGTSDVFDAKSKYGDKITLLGGVDMHKLCTLEECELRAYVREIFHACASERFAIGSGNSIANYVPIQQYMIMVDECNRLRFC